MKHPLIASFEGEQLKAIAEPILSWPPYEGTPRDFGINRDTVSPTPKDWRRQLIAAESGYAIFSPPRVPRREVCRVGIAAGLVVTAFAPSFFATAEDVVSRLDGLPFVVASFGEIFPDEWQPNENLSRHGFANSHVSLGWGCAFKGRGHERLVSRRWLDFGPWRVVRGPDDLTVVQFHDLALDAEAAFGQALPAHERMGISDTGGFIQGPSAAGKGIKYVVSEKLPEGLYDPASRTLEVVVAPGRELSQGEMQDACAYRLNKRSDKVKPIEHVAYVFMTESEARAHLHELWLRELGVWTVDGGTKRRLDDEYRPTPTKPEWVQALEASASS